MHFNYGQCKGFQYVLCSMCCMNYVFILFVVSFYISMCLNFKEWFFLTLLFFLCHVFSWWLYVYYVDYIFYAMYLYVLKNQIMVHFSLGDCMFIMLSIMVHVSGVADFTHATHDTNHGAPSSQRITMIASPRGRHKGGGRQHHLSLR
jgi:hypothetical protein